MFYMRSKNIALDSFWPLSEFAADPEKKPPGQLTYQYPSTAFCRVPPRKDASSIHGSFVKWANEKK
jgi:hypothetical protein